MAEEYIILTPFNCVRECSLLLSSPKERNLCISAVLFSLYCGVLIYRTYNKHLNDLEIKMQESVSVRHEELEASDSLDLEPVPVTSNEMLVPDISIQGELKSQSEAESYQVTL
ncbi:uncharacterized protein LOC108606131 [Drosophila busckii]|nr:uncharacterized protein LOC108606131 [Drosophila busckii]